ncbi:cuticle protein 12.5-like [Wyeomyia smithii]|uniref:cuticle protein 12.5-like n=1 Tax=Wyeomyia smithii TaxID=174621 RepID=UPI002467FE4F|nr:cuticle protein 12.5-like [Wyeomyia smithii]
MFRFGIKTFTWGTVNHQLIISLSSNTSAPDKTNSNSKMFAKLLLLATLAVASVSAKPGLLAGAPVAYSAPLVAAAAPAVAYTAGYANVGDSAVVSSYNSQVINPAYAAYSAPLTYAAAPAYAAPLAYAARAAPFAAPLTYASPLAARLVL